MIDFDHAATTKMSPEALKAYTQVATDFYQNSESLHRAGTESGQLVQEAQVAIARKLKVLPDGLLFTSGGTEANQVGIAALAAGATGKTILVSPLEHSSVYEQLDLLARTQAFIIQTLPVDASGHVTPAALSQALTPDVGLIVIQAVNGITGVGQDLAALLKAANGVPMFVDAVQALGKVPLDLRGLAGWSASAHKFNGPKSCGFLYLAPSVLTKPRFHHVFQQNGFLPGTLDVPGIVAAAVAFDAAIDADNSTHLKALRQALLAQVAPSIKPVLPDSEFAGIVGLLLPHTQGQAAATTMGQRGVCFSTVSACSIKDPRPDQTLTALGLSDEQAKRFIRISFGPENTLAEVAQVAKLLNENYA